MHSYMHNLLFLALFLSVTLSSPPPFHTTLSEKVKPFLEPCHSIEPVAQRTICQLLAAIDAEGPIHGSYEQNNTRAQTGDAQAAQKTSYINTGSKEEDGNELNVTQPRCEYREQSGPSFHTYASERTHDLQEALTKYAAMHRRCTSLEYDKLLDIYQKKRNPQCRYVIWSCTFGLGNKIMSLVSTFLYAILSQRVLLIDNPGWDALFCNPFKGSSWLAPRGLSLKDDESPFFSEYADLKCGAEGSSTKCDTKVVAVEFRMETTAADHRLLVCPSAMAKVKNVPFFNFRNSNQHFAPGYFLNPALRPMLQALFPERNPFHVLSSFLLSPSDAVWEQISKLHRRYLEGAVKRIGVQMRESKGEYRAYFDKAVPLCIRSKSGLCPIDMEDAIEQQEDTENSTNYISVFVSSLVGGHFYKLQESLGQLERELKQRFVVFAQEADEQQLDDVSHQQKALVDMWVLSMSDVLLTSHMSTFGYTAQGLAGIIPYHLKPWPDNPCWLSVSSDPCFHFAPKNVDCEEDGIHIHNPEHERGDADEMIVSKCPDLPETGLQLIQS